MTAQPIVRAARPEEYDLLGELVVGAYRSVGSDDEEYEPHLRDVAGRAGTAEVLAVEVDGRTVGTATLVPPGAPMAEVTDHAAATIRMLAVDAGARGMGAGEALVRACIDRARDLGTERVRLHTEPFMTAARRLYERLGFERDPEHDLAFEPDIVLLAYVLELRVQAPAEGASPAEG
ncbi:MAG: GNAT family N-acetyltransferase [Chloroflexota bacterium]